MKLKILRRKSDNDDQGTFGRMILEGYSEWDSLELPSRGNQNGLSCILPLPGEPSENYTARIAWSDHFGRNLYHLQDADGRHAIEIHNANFAGDVTKGWKSQLHGCCAPGLGVGELDRGDGVMQRAVLHSVDALNQFMSAAGGADLEIEVAWDESSIS